MSFINAVEVGGGLYRGPRPTGFNLRELKLLYNIQTCIDLEGPQFEKTEEDVCMELNIFPMFVPMSSITRPELAKVKMAISFIQASKRPIYIHCHQGVDRTGIVCAAYRVWVQDWPVAKAWKEMMQMGFHEWRYFFWLPRIRKILEA